MNLNWTGDVIVPANMLDEDVIEIVYAEIRAGEYHLPDSDYWEKGTCNVSVGEAEEPAMEIQVDGTLIRLSADAEQGDEYKCPKSPSGKHEPDLSTATIAHDGEFYVDAKCVHCGRSGCIGSLKTLTENASW
jgi:hypothetical protein